MSVEELNTESSAAQSSGSDTRERSSIKFPYKNLNDAIKVAKTTFNKTGHGECEFDQLASGLDFSPKSSGFRLMISTATLFGLIVKSGPESYKLTDLGAQIIDKSKEKSARVESFLSVPLFREVYAAYRGSPLPPPAAIEREISSMGVAEKQKDRARQVLLKSAEQAGFFESGRDRLVKPAVKSLGAMEHLGKDSDETHSDDDNQKADTSSDKTGGGGGGVLPPDLDPIIAGLIARLPKSGSEWPEAERTLWLGILESTFSLVYKDSGT